MTIIVSVSVDKQGANHYNFGLRHSAIFNPKSAIFWYGGVAQLVRARGSYPRRPGFDSLHRHFLTKGEG